MKFFIFINIFILSTYGKPISSLQIDRAKRIAILPGSFDPITNGHIDLANSVIKKGLADYVLFLPNNNPPHKKTTDLKYRMRMIERALKNEAKLLSPSDTEFFELQKNSSPLSRSKVVKKIREQNPDIKLSIIAGSDFTTNPSSILIMNRNIKPDQFIIASRKGFERQNKRARAIAKIKNNFVFINSNEIESISSSKVRESIKSTNGIAESIVRKYIPPSVGNYILEKNLYQGEAKNKRSLLDMIKTTIKEGFRVFFKNSKKKPEINQDLYIKLQSIALKADSSYKPKKNMTSEAYYKAQIPDLYLDGKSLANNLTQQILSSDLKIKRGFLKYVPFTRNRSYQGSPIRYSDNHEYIALRDWILSQPEDSVTPDKLYRKAFEVTKGNITNGMTLVWDTLLISCPWTTRERNNCNITKKLVDITGEYDPKTHKYKPLIPAVNRENKIKTYKDGSIENAFRGLLKRGDKFGSWYHFAGTAFNSYTRTASLFHPFPGQLETRAMIFLEENVLFRHKLGDANKRKALDYAGVNFGNRLAQNLILNRDPVKFSKSQKGKNTDYLYEDGKRFGEKWKLKPGQAPRDFGTNRRTLFFPEDPLSRFAEGLASDNVAEKYYALTNLPNNRNKSVENMLKLFLQYNEDPVLTKIAISKILKSKASRSNKSVKNFSQMILSKENKFLLKQFLEESGALLKQQKFALGFQEALLESYQVAKKDPMVINFIRDNLQFFTPSEALSELIIESYKSNPKEWKRAIFLLPEKHNSFKLEVFNSSQINPQPLKEVATKDNCFKRIRSFLW